MKTLRTGRMYSFAKRRPMQEELALFLAMFAEKHECEPTEIAAPNDVKEVLGDAVTLDTSVPPGHVYMVLA
jgi:hypothetical protein